jgi:hypothetical protein
MEAYIKSTFVKTPMVLEPSGSTSRAIFSPSELAKSVLAPVTARMMELGLVMNLRSMSRICRSMSFGCVTLQKCAGTGLGWYLITDRDLVVLLGHVLTGSEGANLGEAWQIDQSQSEHPWREDAKVDGKWRDACSYETSVAARRKNEPAFLAQTSVGDRQCQSVTYLPVLASVSATISSRILLKSKNFSPGCPTPFTTRVPRARRDGPGAGTLPIRLR